MRKFSLLILFSALCGMAGAEGRHHDGNGTGPVRLYLGRACTAGDDFLQTMKLLITRSVVNK